MNPRIEKVYPLNNYELRLIFKNGEEKIFDVKPYLNIGVFKALNDLELFNTVRPFLGSIAWANNIDLSPDTLYLESKQVTASQNPSS
jgi:hypothetical protein